MLMIKLEFPIKAVAKERARSTKFGHHYTPSKTAKFERFIRDYSRPQMSGRQPLESNLELLIAFQLQKPKSTKLVYPHQDLDNFCKSLLDGMNGVVYNDDKQVVLLAASKNWGDKDLITVEIHEV